MARKKIIQTYDTHLWINDDEVDHMNLDEQNICLAAELFMGKQDGNWQKKIKKTDTVTISIEPGIKEVV